MIDDALRAEIKDTLTGYLSKGTSAILSGVGGTGIKMILNLLVEGTTDPTAAMLQKIYNELSEIKNQIKNLPHAASVFSDYDTAIKVSKRYTATIAEMLSFNEDRQELFDNYKQYLLSLRPEQWETMTKFLTIEPKETYYSFINGILDAAYEVEFKDVTRAKPDSLIAFGGGSENYARLLSESVLGDLPANLYEYVNTQTKVRNTVFAAIGGVISCAQLILKTFQDVAAWQKENDASIDSKSLEKILKTLNNPEVKNNFAVTAQQPIPNILTKLLIPIVNAPAYLCGNAYTVFNAIDVKQNIQLKNIGAKKSLVLSGPEGASIGNRIKGDCDYWSTGFSDANIGWTVEFKSSKDSTITISAPNIGYLYMYNPEPALANRIWVSPSKTNFGEFGYGKNSYTWKLQIVPKGSIKSGPGAFNFIIINIKEDKALVNRKFIIDSKGIGSYSLEKDNADHQWELIPV